MEIRKQKLLLLVEDETLIAMSEKMNLEKYGYKVILADSGEEAIKISQKNNEIDLIIMDIDLGTGIDGTVAAKQILKIREIPILFLSSHIEPEIVEKTEVITSYGYVVKNSSITVLDASIKMAFKLFDAKINERIKEEAYKKSEEKYRSIVENIPDVSWATDGKSNISFITANVEKIYGYTQKEIYEGGEKLWFGRIHHADVKNVKSTYKKLLTKNFPFDIEYRIMHKNGNWIWLHDRSTGTFKKDGKIYASGLFVDITKRKKIEESLRDSEEKYRVAFMTSPDSININSLNGRYIDINEGFTRLTGYTEDDVIGRLSSEINIWTFPEDRKKLIKGLTETGRVENLESVFRCKDGSVKTALMSAHLITIHNEPHILSITRDISNRKNNTKEILESELKFRSIFEGVVDGLVSVDKDTKILDVNSAFTSILELDKKDVVGKTGFFLAKKLLTIKDIPKVVKFMKDNVLNKPTTSVEFQHLDKILEVRTSKKQKNDRYIAIIRDITEYRKVQKELQESEKKYKSLFDSINIGVALHEIVTDKNNKPIDFIWLDSNPKYERMTQLKKADIIGKRGLEVIPNLEPVWIERYGRVAQTGEAMTIIDHTEYLDRDWEIKAYSPKKNQFAVAVKDITEQKKSKDKIQNLLNEKEILLKEVHHRIKNNMSILKSILSLQSRDQDIPEATSAFQDAIGRINSMAVLYDKLYKTNHYINLSIKQYLSQLTKEILQIYPNWESVKINFQIDEFSIDSDKIFSLGIILNELLTNTMKYAFIDKDDKKINISISKKNKHIVFIYQDNGIGISEDELNKSKKGFGLYLIDILVQQINGNYKIEANNGTKFIIEFNKN